MDEFDDLLELDGTLMSLEFAPNGRIRQLWAADPASDNPDEQFQYAAPLLGMGDETTADYLPGTVLLGIRTSPDDPWVVVRVNEATIRNEGDPSGPFRIEYDLGFLDELTAVGVFEELENGAGTLWTLTLTNVSRRPVEIGELALPFALNDAVRPNGADPQSISDSLDDRVVVHRATGGTGAYLLARRLNGAGGGLMIAPYGGTSWEVIASAPVSLRIVDWGGVAVAYVHSAATAEREAWTDFAGESGATVLEPGDRKVVQTVFLPVSSDSMEKPGAGGLPRIEPVVGLVAPRAVGIGLEISGVTPALVETDVQTELESDADEGEGFIFVRPAAPGPVRLQLTDIEGHVSDYQLLTTLPIEQLIERRAAFVLERQRVMSGPLENAFAPFDLGEESRDVQTDTYRSPLGIESGLSDALFLAEKLAISPHEDQLSALRAFLDDFVPRRVQNPGTGAVGESLGRLGGTPEDVTRPETYALMAATFFAASRIPGQEAYRERALLTLEAMYRHAFLPPGAGIGLMGANARDAGSDLPTEGVRRRKELARHPFPFLGSQALQISLRGFEELLSLDLDRQKEAHWMSVMAAHVSPAPNWWSYGDVRDADRIEDFAFNRPHGLRRMRTANSALVAGSVLARLHRGPLMIRGRTLSALMGGMVGHWALVRPDGAAADGYWAEPSAVGWGLVPTSGRVGIGLATYLRYAASMVFRDGDEMRPFLSHYDRESKEDGRDVARIEPWDGIGRRVVLRRNEFDIEAHGARLKWLELDDDRRALRVAYTISGASRTAHLRVRGLWGNRFRDDGGRTLTPRDGVVEVPITVDLPNPLWITAL